jgi:outer membrane protein assembly factor BamB
VIVESTVVVGGADGLVYALNLATGTKRWTVTTGGRVRATPAIADGAVIVGSWDGRVYALDLASGHQRWVHKTIGDTLDSHKAGFDRRAVQSSAAIDGGKVFVGSRDVGSTHSMRKLVSGSGDSVTAAPGWWDRRRRRMG